MLDCGEDRNFMNDVVHSLEKEEGLVVIAA